MNYGLARGIVNTSRSIEINCPETPEFDWSTSYEFTTELTSAEANCSCPSGTMLDLDEIAIVKFIELHITEHPVSGPPTIRREHRVIAVDGQGNTFYLGYSIAPSEVITPIYTNSYMIEVTASEPIILSDNLVSIDFVERNDVFGRFDDDINGNGRRDWMDRIAFGVAFGSVLGDPNYTPRADYDLDGDVDSTDRSTFLSHVNYADGNANFPTTYDYDAGCTFDVDNSGFLDFDDYSAFIAYFIPGDPEADADGSGSVDTDDFDTFTTGFTNGEC